jgi:DNA-binding NtrC family response regulator
MPKLGGRECFLEMKKLDPGVRAIIMTGYTAEDIPQQLLDAGVVDCIEKPLDLRQFTQKVKDAILA